MPIPTEYRKIINRYTLNEIKMSSDVPLTPAKGDFVRIENTNYVGVLVDIIDNIGAVVAAISMPPKIHTLVHEGDNIDAVYDKQPGDILVSKNGTQMVVASVNKSPNKIIIKVILMKGLIAGPIADLKVIPLPG